MKTTLMALGLAFLLVACAKNSNSGDAISAPEFVSINEADHQVGNGGAGVCLPGSPCMTLAEAGLRIAGPEEEFFVPSPETTRAVIELAENLPLGDYRDQLVRETIGEGATFKVLDIADPAKLEVIRQEYANVLKKYESSIDINTVKIFAFEGHVESTSITYLLPEFFNLSVERQAKVLIHERNIRKSNESQFELVLEYDGLIEDLSKDSNLFLNEKFRVDRWEVLGGKFQGGSPYKGSSVVHSLAWLASRGIILEYQQFCEKSSFTTCDPDPLLVTATVQVPAALMRIFSSNVIIHHYSVESKPEYVQICEKYLKGRQKVDVLFPVAVGFDYQLLLVNCIDKGGPTVESVGELR